MKLDLSNKCDRALNPCTSWQAMHMQGEFSVSEKACSRESNSSPLATRSLRASNCANPKQYGLGTLPAWT